MNYCHIDSPIGRLLVAGDDEAVRYIEFPRNGKAGQPDPDWRESMRGPVAEAVRQLREYFDGGRTQFDLPLAPEGTPFQCTVWRQLQEIPYGKLSRTANWRSAWGIRKHRARWERRMGKTPSPS